MGVAPLDFALKPVSGGARKILDDRLPAAYHTIKDRRLADIRATDDSHHRKYNVRGAGGSG